MFKIAKIGIEFEFEVPGRIERVMPFASAFVEQFNKDNPQFIIEVDREYYANQIEFKLRATDKIEEGIQYFQAFLHSCYRGFVDINCVGNPFVGTHFHLFLEKDGEPYSQLARGKKLPIFNYVYSYFKQFLSDNKLGIRPEVIAHEAKRLSMNHNILRHFDRQYLKDGIRKNLEAHNTGYPMFHNGINRPKYAPVIWSLANLATGKPHSLEVRAIPNSWLLTATTGEVFDFVCQIEKILNERHNPRFDYVSSILDTNNKLIKLAMKN